MRPLKILFAVSEIDGLVKSGGLADVARALPEKLVDEGQDVRIVCPYYRQIREQYPDAEQVASLSFALPGHHYQCTARQLKSGKLTVYVIDYPDYFDRAGMYSDSYEGYGDNGRRFSFFSLACLELALHLGFAPDIIHCNDWQTAPVAMFLKQRFAALDFFAATRSVLSIHNAAYQGIYSLSSVRLSDEIPPQWEDELRRGDGLISLLQTGVVTADKLVAVSPTYADELATPLGSHGLYTSFKQRRQDLVGILNGCDYSSWDPAKDQTLPANYQRGDTGGKAICKRRLQQEMGLPQRSDVPLLAMVARLTDQKGLALLLPAIEALQGEDLQIAVIGTGDPFLCSKLAGWATTRPEKIAFHEGYTEALSRLANAGSDYFLMPSLFEPCGLTQMYALAYGSLPIVRAVGGLKDTVTDCETRPADGNGLSFEDPEPAALTDKIRFAARLWREDPAQYQRVQQRAMNSRFTWQQNADSHLALYRQLLA